MIGLVLAETIEKVKKETGCTDLEIAMFSDCNNSYIHRLRTYENPNPSVKMVESILSSLERYDSSIKEYFYKTLVEVQTGIKLKQEVKILQTTKLETIILDFLPINEAIELIEKSQEELTLVEQKKTEIESILSGLYDCISKAESRLRSLGLDRHRGYDVSVPPINVEETVPILNSSALRKLRAILRAMQDELDYSNSELREYLGLSEAAFVELFIGLESMKEGIEDTVSFQWNDLADANEFAQKIRKVARWRDGVPLLRREVFYENFQELESSLKNGTGTLQQL